MRRFLVTAVALIALIPVGIAFSEEHKDESTDCRQTFLPREDIQPILERVTAQTGKKFIVSDRVPSHIVVGTIDPKSITYPVLLSILGNNGLAAISHHGVVSIVTDANIRQEQVPTIFGETPGVADDEIVTEVYRAKFTSTAQLVPILRPLIPQYGHLAAVPEQNALLIVDRYGNVRRIVGIVRELDKPTTKSNQP